MVTKHEKEQLRHNYQCNPASAISLLLTCAAGLLLLWVLAVVGSEMMSNSDVSPATQAASAAR